jgi:hypothetical protein
MAATLEINGKSFIPAFGMKFFKILGKQWNVPGINGVIEHLTLLESITNDLSFAQIEVISSMIMASIEANPNNSTDITADEIEEMMIQNVAGLVSIIEEMMKELIESMPKAQGEVGGKPKAVKK